jgi:hypothetical protein
MLMSDAGYDVGATLRLVLLAEGLRRAEVTLLHALALVRGVEPDLGATSAIALPEREVHDLLDATQELGDRVEQLQMLAEQVRRGDIEIRLKTLQLEAEAALSAGAADIERVEVLARCLPMRAGFQALAAALRCTDAHQSWAGATVGHLLASFRDADTHLVRHLTGLATLSPDIRWGQCDREQITRLSVVLERHAAANRQ